MEEKKKVESEINFKSLLKNPIRLFSLVYIYFFIVALVIGVYYVNNLDAVSFNTVPGTSLDTLNVVREIETKVGGMKPAMDLTLITEPTQELIAKGKNLYKTTCASCHGDEGKGDGVAAAALNPKPRNFHSAEGWTNGRTFYDLYKTVNDGVPGTGMTAYEFISPEDRVAIIQYIRTLGDYPEVTMAEVKDKLDATYNLSAGIVDPNHIPIKESISILADENKKNIELSMTITDKIKNDNVKSANLLKENSLDLEKVVYNYITKLNQEDYNSFIQKLDSDPVSLGFKASIVNLMDNDIKLIYLYLKNVSG
ncbi:MAG: cytochrome c [Chlorobi bacterium]|nr:cytochrome c [Chlorobiota bacterium]